MNKSIEILEKEIEALRQTNRALVERIENAESRQLEALEDSEQRFKALHNASFGGIAIHDKGVILDCNHGLSVMTGFAVDELMGMNGLLLISEKMRDFVRSQIVARYEKPYEAIGVRKNGEEYPLRLEAREIPYRGKPVRVVEFRDITEQKRAEEELRLSQERLAIAMDAARSGLWDWDVQENRVFYDTRYFTLAGYEPNEFPHAFDEWSKRVHPEDLGYCQCALQDYLSGHAREFNIDFRFLRKGGDWMWIRGHGKVARRDAQGAITRIVGIHTDISDLKQAEASLRQSENRFKTLVQNSGDITQIIDIHGKALYVSGQVETIVGYSTQEILDMESTLDLIHPDDQPTAVGTIQACIPIPDSRGSAEYRYWHKEGRWIWLEATGSNLLHNPFVKGLFLIVRDISARKQAEVALRESEEKLQALFASMTEMVVLHEVVMDPLGQPVNYRITDCNRAYGDITGIMREAAVGKLATEVYGTPVPPYLEEFTRVALSGEPHHFETYFPPMDKHFAISVVSPGKNRFATISTDITDTKKIQHVIASKNKELEQLVYVASHDLRSPLVNVDGYGRELEYALGEIIRTMECENVDASKLEALIRTQLPDMSLALRHIRTSTKQMDGLLKGLLKLSRMGRAAMTIVPLRMNELVGRVVSSLEFQIRKLKVTVSVGELPPCRGDEVQVIQVFANLLENALKYLDPSRLGVIAIRGIEDGNRCVYCVEDNGVGIPLEQCEKVFELFYRLEPSKTDGEGLGLTIIRQILSRLDGDIRVDSTLGEGSRFYVALPRDKTSQLERTEASA